MEEVSLLCAGFEQLLDPGLLMATEEVEVNEHQEGVLSGGECHVFASQGLPSCFEQLLWR